MPRPTLARVRGGPFQTTSKTRRVLYARHTTPVLTMNRERRLQTPLWLPHDQLHICCVLIAASKPSLLPLDLGDAVAGSARQGDRGFVVELAPGIAEMSDGARRVKAIAGLLIVGIAFLPQRLANRRLRLR